MSAQGKRLADIATDEFAGELDQAKRHSIQIPEWQNVTIYWGPWTNRDLGATVFSTGWADMGSPERAVRALVVKAQDENGKPLFVAPEVEQLMDKARPAILDRISAALFATLNLAEDGDAAAKK